jgi:hypothetical protein
MESPNNMSPGSGSMRGLLYLIIAYAVVELFFGVFVDAAWLHIPTGMEDAQTRKQSNTSMNSDQEE